MILDPKLKSALERLFPGVIIDWLACNLHIRTDNWQITYDELSALDDLGLKIDEIYTEGDGMISLVVSKI